MDVENRKNIQELFEMEMKNRNDLSKLYEKEMPNINFIKKMVVNENKKTIDGIDIDIEIYNKYKDLMIKEQNEKTQT